MSEWAPPMSNWGRHKAPPGHRRTSRAPTGGGLSKSTQDLVSGVSVFLLFFTESAPGVVDVVFIITVPSVFGQAHWTQRTNLHRT